MGFPSYRRLKKVPEQQPSCMECLVMGDMRVLTAEVALAMEITPIKVQQNGLRRCLRIMLNHCLLHRFTSDR